MEKPAPSRGVSGLKKPSGRGVVATSSRLWMALSASSQPAARFTRGSSTSQSNIGRAGSARESVRTSASSAGRGCPGGTAWAAASAGSAKATSAAPDARARTSVISRFVSRRFVIVFRLP